MTQLLPDGESPRLRPRHSWVFIRYFGCRFRQPRLLNLVRCPKPPSWNNPLSTFKLFRKPFKRLSMLFRIHRCSRCFKDRAFKHTTILDRDEISRYRFFDSLPIFDPYMRSCDPIDHLIWTFHNRALNAWCERGVKGSLKFHITHVSRLLRVFFCRYLRRNDVTLTFGCTN